MLGLLESVERDAGQTQRRLAAELGVALGLVNSYLRRCVKKGFVKVAEAPARRYAYYLTPKGLSAKTRLTIDYLAYSLSLFRRARADYLEVIGISRARGCKRLVLAGASDIAEIATICAMHAGMEIVAVVDRATTQPSFAGAPVVKSFERLNLQFDAVLITDLTTSVETYTDMINQFGPRRVYAPRFLGLLSQLMQKTSDLADAASHTKSEAISQTKASSRKRAVVANNERSRALSPT